MQLVNMQIRKMTYGVNEGKLIGDITYSSPNGTVQVILTPELSDKLIAVVAEDMVKATKELATQLTAATINQAAAQLEDKSSE